MVNSDSSLSHPNLGSNMEQYHMESSGWSEIDEWGPEKVLQVYDPDIAYSIFKNRIKRQ